MVIAAFDQTISSLYSYLGWRDIKANQTTAAFLEDIFTETQLHAVAIVLANPIISEGASESPTVFPLIFEMVNISF